MPLFLLIWGLRRLFLLIWGSSFVTELEWNVTLTGMESYTLDSYLVLIPLQVWYRYRYRWHLSFFFFLSLHFTWTCLQCVLCKNCLVDTVTFSFFLFSSLHFSSSSLTSRFDSFTFLFLLIFLFSLGSSWMKGWWRKRNERGRRMMKEEGERMDKWWRIKSRKRRRVFGREKKELLK